MFDHIFSFVDILAQHGISHAVISPGSRNAPLSLAFSRHSSITTSTIADERTAGFTALGMAEQLDKPVILVCTSGSAAYNYAPAVAEAYFRRIPLIIMTADRPPEWIDQLDGQTIRQKDIFGKHVKASFTLPDDFDHSDKVWHAQRIINQAALISEGEVKGPVHINCPFREPFYPAKDWKPKNLPIQVIDSVENTGNLSDEYLTELKGRFVTAEQVVILIGQNQYDEELNKVLSILSRKKVVIIGDVVSNISVKDSIKHQDLFLGALSENGKKVLKPDLLITFGLSIISKNLKLFLRSFKANEHWHIDRSESIVDTFQSLNLHIKASPLLFLKWLASIEKNVNTKYLESWKEQDDITNQVLSEFRKQNQLNELVATGIILEKLNDCDVYLANSMAIRWANFYNTLHQNVRVFCNRGTSGIDGCTSTALGGASISGKPTVLITGDVAFFYDRNAFWQNHIPENLKIVLFNNSGGGIFRMIKGPRDQEELEDVFESTHNLTAKYLADEYGLDYRSINSVNALKEEFTEWVNSTKSAGIMEIFTDKEDNRKSLEELKSTVQSTLLTQ